MTQRETARRLFQRKIHLRIGPGKGSDGGNIFRGMMKRR
jgi:hypothetical protein